MWSCILALVAYRLLDRLEVRWSVRGGLLLVEDELKKEEDAHPKKLAAWRAAGRP
jgi:hypothetical protein